MIVLLLLLHSTFAQNHKRISLGQSYQGQIGPDTYEDGLFSLIVPFLTPKSDLVFMVRSVNPDADPNIFISRTVPAPKSQSDADVMICQAKGIDTCVLRSDQVQSEETLYIAIISQIPCFFSFRVDLDEELILGQNDMIIFKMNNTQESKVIQFNIGELYGNESEFEIVVTARNFNELEEPFHVYMNRAENQLPSNEKYDYIAQDLDDTKQIELQISEIHANDSFYILIEAPQGAIFELQTITNSQIKDIQGFIKKNQLVKKGDVDFYQFILTKELSKYNPDYEIILIPYEGFASLFVNPNTQPPLLDNYKQSERVTRGESIVLKPQELQEQLLKFYIAVYGEELCSYQLQIVPLFGNASTSKELYPNLQNLRTVERDELLKLFIQLPITNSALALNFQAIKGKFRYILSDCSFSKQLCHIFNWEEVQNQTVIKSDSKIIYSDSIDFEHVKVNCTSICEWRILIVLDKSSDVNKGKLSITYNIQKEQIKLIENTPYKSYVEPGQQDYYSFKVQDKVEKISFLLTPISGHPIMYMSTSKKFPNENEYDQVSNNAITIVKDQQIVGKTSYYFISVKGVSASKYTITAWVIRSEKQNGQYPWNYIQLFQGSPQNQQLNNNEVGLYKVEIPNSHGSFAKIQITLQINYGTFKIFAFKQPEINVTKCDWMSDTRILQISDFQSNYSDILYIRIELNEIYSGSYQIFYTIEDQEIQLFLGNQFHSFLKANHYQNFMYALKFNETILIQKQAMIFDQDKLEMTIHLNRDVQNLIYVDYSKNRNTAQISFKEGVNIECYVPNGICTYIKIEFSAKEDLFYSLIVAQENLEIQLYDNQPITKQFVFSQDYFYLITDGQEVSVIVTSLSMELTIIAKIEKNKTQSHATFENYDKVSMRHIYNQQSSIFFSEKELLICEGICHIKLTVLQNDNSTDSLGEYTIQYNSKILLLNERQTISGQIIDSAMAYFRIQLYDDNKNLMILVTPLDICEIDVYVSKNKYPTVDENDWRSTELLGDALIIESGNQKYSKMSGNYILGIFGEDQCQFTIQYSTGNMQFYDILNNSPQNILIKEQEIIYFRYIGNNLLPITLFLSSQSGQAVMFIEKIDSINSDFSYLQKEITTYVYSNQGKGFKDYFSVVDLGLECTIAVALKGAFSEEVFLQINSGEVQKTLKSGILYKNQIFAYQQQTFELQTQDQNLTVFIYIQSGNISAEYSLTQNVEPQFSQVLEIKKYLNIFDINVQGYICTIKVQCLVDSIFTIQFQSESSKLKQIKSIHPQYFLLRAHEYGNFSYQSSNFGSKDNIFSISLGKIINSPLQNKFRNTLPEITVYAHNQDYKLTPSLLTQTQYQIYLEYQEIDSIYEINVLSTSQIDEQYYIQIGSQNIKPLVSKQKIIQSSKVKETNYWFVTPDGENDQIFYDIQFCGGLFQVYIDSDIEKLRNNQYEIQIQANNKGQALGVLDISGQEVIFKVTLLKLIDQQASYTLYIYKYNSQIIVPYTLIYPDDQGALSHTIQEDNGVKYLSVSFAPLYYGQSNNFLVEWVDYYLLLQESTNNSINYCQESYQNSKLTLEGHQKSQEATINVIIKDNDILADKQFVYTIIAQARLRLQNDEEISLDYKYAQYPINLRTFDTQRDYLYILIVILAIMFVAICVVLIQIKRKQDIDKYEIRKSTNIELNYRGLSE